jgi:hypothetical protein
MKSSKIYLVLLTMLVLVAADLRAQVKTVGALTYSAWQAYDGYNLHFPHNQASVYLLDNCGRIVHMWEDSLFRPGNGVYLTEDGDIYVCKGRGALSNPDIHAGGGGEKIERRDWDNNVTWTYTLNDENFRLHHDIAVMPNGNILAIAWEAFDSLEAIQAGRNPAQLADGALWPDMIVELEPVGTDDANIVWEWHAWDHLIQDFDPSKDNFGVVGDHPELIDINYPPEDDQADWIHGNSIDYNPDLDQIIFCTPFLDEIWIIDHSTTTAEAAGSTGGLAGRGGDLLFRWGNPEAFGAGDSTDQQLFFPHDAHWLDIQLTSGHPDYNKVGVFNNQAGADYSTVHLFTPTFDSYEWEYTQDGDGTYFPDDFSWSYERPTPQDMYSSGLSSIQRLPNGNTLIAVGRPGYTYEITPSEEIVWEYVNPMDGGNPVEQGTVLNLNANIHFRMHRYGVNYPAFDGKNLDPGEYIEINPDTAFCRLSTDIAAIHDAPAPQLYPNLSADFTQLRDLKAGDMVEVFDAQGRLFWASKAVENQMQIDVRDWPAGMYFVQLNRSTSAQLIVER